MPTPYSSRRRERWTWNLLSRNGSLLQRLDGVTEGRVEMNGNAPMRGSGSLTWEGLDGTQPDWPNVLLQPVYFARTPYGNIEWPLGAFIPATPGTQYRSNGQVRLDVELYDRSLLLSEDAFDSTFTAAAGTVVTDLVRTLLNGVPGINGLVSVVDSTATLSTPMVWEAGTSIQRMVNDLCGAINYFVPYADGTGVLRAEPYRAPGYRPVEWDFVDTKEGVYLPEFGREQDRFHIQNKVVLVGQTNGDAPPLIGSATNTNPNDPLSTNTPDPANGIKGRGYEFAYVETGVEAATQAIIDGLAARKLLELSRPAASLSLRHAMLPLDPNDVVTFKHRSGLDTLAVLQSYSIDTRAGALCDAKYLEVAPT